MPKSKPKHRQSRLTGVRAGWPLVLVALACSAPVEDVPVTALATFNVQMFFDTVCDSESCNGQDDFERAPTQAQFDAHVDELAAAIRKLDADVVTLQEVENQTSLDALHARLADIYPVAVLGETGGDASIDVATLSRGELEEVATHLDRPLMTENGGITYFKRALLETHLRIDGRPTIVFNAHFKSKFNDQPAQRLAEASGARAIVLERTAEFPDALILLAGDLNDTPGSAPLETLEIGGDLRRVTGELGSDAGTIVFGGSYRAIDHIYHSTAGAGAFVVGSASVHRDGRGLANSDHAALRAEFTRSDP